MSCHYLRHLIWFQNNTVYRTLSTSHGRVIINRINYDKILYCNVVLLRIGTYTAARWESSVKSIITPSVSGYQTSLYLPTICMDICVSILYIIIVIILYTNPCDILKVPSTYLYHVKNSRTIIITMRCP